ncbi:MAG: hypothetical protein PQJ58_13290 [Spirochaetales bacterium]|nr:hypothetical protein [Spirochaetales bacterium]
MDYQIKAHGASQLEIKIGYPLDSRRKENRYRMSTVFFIPSQLGVSDSSFSRDKILSDLTVHTRFTTPRIALDDLVDSSCEASPLNRLAQLWKQEPRKGDWRKRVIYELKTLVNIVLSETGRGLDENRLPMEKSFPSVVEDIIGSLLTRLQELESLPVKKGRVKKSLIWTLEALTWLFSDYILTTLKEWPDQEENRKRQNRLEKCFSYLGGVRKKYGWRLPVDLDSQGAEAFVYRSHQLKKWSQESLYLSAVHSRAAERVGQFLLGLAAAVAMAFALGATLISSRLFPEGSLYWALIAIAAYSVKDRMKENLRFLFLRISPFLVADRMQRLRDPRSGRNCGRIRESVTFSDSRQLSDLALLYRRAGKDKLSRGLMKEDILKYKRDFRIRSVPLFRNHSRLEGITDIVRLNLGDWLRKMDSSTEILNCREGDSVKELRCSRVYHVNLVLILENRHTGETGPVVRFRIILGQNGIHRVEELQLSGLEDS